MQQAKKVHLPASMASGWNPDRAWRSASLSSACESETSDTAGVSQRIGTKKPLSCGGGGGGGVGGRPGSANRTAHGSPALLGKLRERLHNVGGRPGSANRTAYGSPALLGKLRERLHS